MLKSDFFDLILHEKAGGCHLRLFLIELIQTRTESIDSESALATRVLTLLGSRRPN